MKSKVLWVTSNEVKVFTLADPPQTLTLRKHGVRHQKESLGKNHPQAQDDVEHFMHEVAKTLEDDEAKILIVGPGQAKIRLKNHLEREHSGLLKNVVGVETLDKSTDGEIVHFARNYFTKLNVFEAI